jgi:sodium/potassium-transporting ATPase subunit alpha
MAAFFLAIVFCQLANVFVWRTTHQSVFTKGLLRNRYVLVGIALEVVLLVVAVATGPGRAVFDTASPPLGAWLVPVPFALAMLGISEAKKAVARRR